MLMLVRKIESTPEKDDSGAIKKHPVTHEKIMKQKIVEEAININMIKGIRPFHIHPEKDNKPGKKKITDEPVSVFYMDGTPAEIRVVGDWKEHIEKVNKLHGYSKISEEAGVSPK